MVQVLAGDIVLFFFVCFGHAQERFSTQLEFNPGGNYVMDQHII